MTEIGPIRVLTAVLTAGAVVISACGAGSGPSTPSPAPASVAAAAPSLAKITISYGADPTNLDPPQGGGITENVLTGQIFDPLVYKTHDGKIVPRLAEKWERLDPTTWRFTLRKGVKFHNGEDFDARAVKFSVDRYKSKLSIQASRFSNIVDVRIVDQYTADIKTEKTDPILPNLFVSGLYMLPPQYDEEKGPQYVAAHPVGTGPYTFKEWVRGDHITLEADPGYWQGKPSIATVIFRPIPEASTRVAALQNREVDIAWEIPPAQIESVKAGSVADIKVVPGPRVVYIGMRATGPKPAPMLADKRVRQALNYAINRKAIVDKLLFGTADLIGQPIAPTYLGHDPAVQPYPYDPQKAKELLAEAGHPNGFSVQLDFANRWLTRDQAQAVQSDLAKVGITATLNDMDPTAYLNSITARTFAPLYTLSIQGRLGLDASEIFDVAIVTKGSFNWNDYSNPAVDKLIAEGDASSDPAVRRQKFQEAVRLLRDDPPWIFMWNNRSIWGIRKGVNWSPRPDDLLFVFDDVR